MISGEAAHTDKIAKANHVDALAIIGKYCQPGSLAHGILVEHGSAVADKARTIALRLSDPAVDVAFIMQAALLHDIGMLMTRASSLGCCGDKDYVCHGYLGREILEREGLYRHALVCERHVGVGLTVRDIVDHALPIPERDMLPLSMEEKIICYADKFFSKDKRALRREKSLDEVRAGIAQYGPEHLRRFELLKKLLKS